MDASRREAFILGAGMLLAGTAADAAPQEPPPGPAGMMRIFRVYNTPDGTSHLQELAVSSPRKPLPVASVQATSFPATVEDWHRAPFKTFTINTAGRIKVELSDGSTRMIGPGDLVYLEDLTGKGHITHLLTAGAALFLRMPDDFDVVAWARS